ncbi:MAG: hypothetical protein MI674_06860 [Cytophagales bacterium]|nr:hypothetical protein [Cytophagales bacterium]
MKLIRKIHTKKINKFFCCLFLIQFSVFEVGAIDSVKINLEKVPEQDQGARSRVVLSGKNDLIDSIGLIADQRVSVMGGIAPDSINWGKMPTGSDIEGERRSALFRIYNRTKALLNGVMKRPRSREPTTSTLETIDNYAKSSNEILPGKLKSDAEEIHKLASNRPFGEFTTILCVALLQKEEEDSGRRAIKKFAFCNAEYFNGRFRDSAESLHYHVVKAEQAHAEGELLQFLMTRTTVYTHVVAIGCSRPYCGECDVLLKLILGPRYLEISGNRNDVIAKPCRKYYIPNSLRKLIEDLTGLEIECQGRYRREITGRKRGVGSSS